jgi:hypothetical protein
MARDRDQSRRPTPTDATPDESPDVLDSGDEFEAADAPEAVPFQASKPNPLEPAYLNSRDRATGDGKDAKGVQMRVPPAGKVFSEDRAKKALALIRRAASEHKGGARTRIVEETVNDATGHALYFAWRPLSTRAYTSADVRTWAGEQTPPVKVPDKGRIPLDVVNAYRKAHGLPESKGGKSKAKTPA